MFQVGNILEVQSEKVWFVCSVTELEPDDVVKNFEECVAMYQVHFEGPENPDVEPQLLIYEYRQGDFYAVNLAEDGFDYHEVSVKKLR